MRYLLIVVVIFMACSDPESPPPDIFDAEFEFLKGNTTTEPFFGYYFLTINFRVKNIGNINIGSYEVFFTLTFRDSSKITKSYLGDFVGVGKEKFPLVRTAYPLSLLC